MQDQTLILLTLLLLKSLPSITTCVPSSPTMFIAFGACSVIMWNAPRICCQKSVARWSS